MNKHIILLLGILSSFNVLAVEIPHHGKHDDRIRFIDYKNDEVVKLVSHYGYSTHVEFSPSEEIKQIALGDKKAWDIAPTGNHLFIKAIGNKALTNMTVLTNRRAYNFVLYAHKSRHGANSNDMMFQIKFKYPDDELKRQIRLAEAERLKKELEKDDKEDLFINWDYWAKGSKAITPEKVYDDGRFTYFTFLPSQEMPAIYVVDKDPGTPDEPDDVELESLVNSHIDPKDKYTIVVHKIDRHFVLRKGKHVTCIINKGFERKKEVATEKGTTIKNVKRVIKGQ